MRVLIIEITGDAAGLSRVLGLTMRLFLFVSVAEHRIVPDSVHLRLVLLPEIKGMRL